MNKHTQPKPRFLPLLALTLALLACAGATNVGGSTPTASFTTATPGGSISISLLTPTITAPGVPNQGILIGALATATAEAQGLVNETATALALTPTATVPGIFVEPAICPASGNPVLPEQSPAFTQYAEIIAQYLSAGGPATLLEARMRAWGALTDYGGLVRADRDFTGDGVPEVMITAFDPNKDTTPQPGDLFIYGCEGGLYRLLYSAGYSASRGAPVIHSADDINGDQLNNLVYSVETCQQTNCMVEVRIIEWGLPLENFQSLLSEAVIQPYAQVVVSDVDEDQLKEVSVTSGVIPQVEAGPQRQLTTIYKWDGTIYALAETIRPIADYRIHVIHDAEDLLMAGTYGEAVTQFRRAITNDRLLSWNYPEEDRYLRAYARYQLMLTYIRAGNLTAAQQAHDQLMAVYYPPITPPPPPCDPAADPACIPPPPPTATPFPQGEPGFEFARIADLFWADFSINRNLTQSCSLVVAYVRTNLTLLDVLNSFGYANRSYTAIDMCPWGQ